MTQQEQKDKLIEVLNEVISSSIQLKQKAYTYTMRDTFFCIQQMLVDKLYKASDIYNKKESY